MHRRSLILGVVASSYFGIRGANAWPLVTRQQSQRENAAPHNETAPAPSRSGAPTIRIVEPDITRPVRSPVNIRIGFHAAPNARIAVNSLRVRYGFLGIDIPEDTCARNANSVWCVRRRRRTSQGSA